MAHVQRIETLSRHLTTATGLDMVSVADDLADSTVQVGQFNPRELYEYTVRDNLELRDRILDFLKVLITAVGWFLVQQQTKLRLRIPFVAHLLICNTTQGDIFKPNHYLSLLEFRQLTLERLQKFVAQQYFITKDYIDGKPMPSKLLVWGKNNPCNFYT